MRSLKLLNQHSRRESGHAAEEEEECSGGGGGGGAANSDLSMILALSKMADSDARAIWMQSVSDGAHSVAPSAASNGYAFLYQLYPYLLGKFAVATRSKNRCPSIQQMEHYFLRTGGKYLRRTNFPVIHISKFERFYRWFLSMCAIVAELGSIYNDYNLDCLFYGKRTSTEILSRRPSGTFILSLTHKLDCLALKYKKSSNKNNDICTILLLRRGRDSYAVNKSKATQSLFQIIRPRTYLKYLYTPQMLIDKKALF